METGIQLTWDHPTLLVVTTLGQPSEAQFDAYLHEMAESLYWEDTHPRIVVHDTRYGGQVSAAQRKQQADFLRDHWDRLRELTLGTVFVTESPLIRGMLTAILWFQRLPSPHFVTGTMAAALDWGESRLKERGFALPKGARGRYT